MQNRVLVFVSSPAEHFAAFSKQTNCGEPQGHHAEADPPQLHRQPGLRPGAPGPVLYSHPYLCELFPRWLCERGRPAETHSGQGRGRAPRWRASQTGPGHLHHHVLAAVPDGAAHCLLYQLPAEELFFCLHAI